MRDMSYVIPFTASCALLAYFQSRIVLPGSSVGESASAKFPLQGQKDCWFSRVRKLPYKMKKSMKWFLRSSAREIRPGRAWMPLLTCQKANREGKVRSCIGLFIILTDRKPSTTRRNSDVFFEMYAVHEKCAKAAKGKAEHVR